MHGGDSDGRVKRHEEHHHGSWSHGNLLKLEARENISSKFWTIFDVGWKNIILTDISVK